MSECTLVNNRAVHLLVPAYSKDGASKFVAQEIRLIILCLPMLASLWFHAVLNVFRLHIIKIMPIWCCVPGYNDGGSRFSFPKEPKLRLLLFRLYFRKA